MYIAGLVIPVPGEKMEAYRKWAENGAQIFKDYGCLEIVECWEDYVPDGTRTDVWIRPGSRHSTRSGLSSAASRRSSRWAGDEISRSERASQQPLVEPA